MRVRRLSKRETCKSEVDPYLEDEIEAYSRWRLNSRIWRVHASMGCHSNEGEESDVIGFECQLHLHGCI